MIVCRGKFPMNMPSAKYKEWHKDASAQLAEQKIEPIVGPIVQIAISFVAPDRRKFDLTNKAESIMDLLVDNGIIEDDNYSIVPRVTLVFVGVDKENCGADITMYV